ncbi:MAG: hypothetical protein CVT92_10970 [Bacteroidetes bacterium HGW-Bacteroidetes-1]|nr:MAG: hypothetical protein CVT92_10970 [Bacteroidetes bacterium HGW-Bacteroidetes-1]
MVRHSELVLLQKYVCFFFKKTSNFVILFYFTKKFRAVFVRSKVNGYHIISLLIQIHIKGTGSEVANLRPISFMTAIAFEFSIPEASVPTEKH